MQASSTPPEVHAHAAVALLRQVWIQQFYADATAIRLRMVADLLPAALLIGSPYDPDARLSTKRATTWNGYKVHLTETCDADMANLITDVQTTPATRPDGQLTGTIQAALAARQLLPAEQDVDCAYTDAATISASETTHGIELVGPVQRDGSWQAQADAGFAGACFAVDWATKQVVCPQGQTNRIWSASTDTAGQVEGSIAQGVRAFELRAARYCGMVKTTLQHSLTVLAINLTRLVAWWEGRPKAQTRPSRFAAACVMLPRHQVVGHDCR